MCDIRNLSYDQLKSYIEELNVFDSRISELARMLSGVQSSNHLELSTKAFADPVVNITFDREDPFVLEFIEAKLEREVKEAQLAMQRFKDDFCKQFDKPQQ